MKVISKEAIFKRNQLKYAEAEANILEHSNHPFVLSLHFAFQVSQLPNNRHQITSIW